MKTFKIFLAVIMIMLASNLLSGCSVSDELAEANLSKLSMARLEAARETKKSVTVDLVEVSNQKELVVNLMLHNPENKPLSSAEIWLTYHPEKLKGLHFGPNVESFDLTAPYFNGFDQESGLFKLGRSTAQPIPDEVISLGQLTFEKLADEAAFIDIYDYAYNLSGHASVNMMVGKEPVNLLIQPASPLFVHEN